MARVLVTGANGFVGRHVSRFLLDRGYAVVAAVRTPDAVNQLVEGAEASVIGELERADWSTTLESVDFVVHLAAHVHRLHGRGEGGVDRYHEVNAVGTKKLAVGASKAGVTRLVYLSSVKAVGEGYVDPERAYGEGDSCLPQDAYGRSKRAAETLLGELANMGHLRVSVLRPPLVYGPGVKANFLSLLRAVDRGLPLPLASVRNRRSLLFVGNLVNAIERCLQEDESREPFELFFVSDEESVSTPDLIARMARHLKRSSRLVRFPVPLLRRVARVLGKQAAIDRLTGSLVVDTSRIQATLGWKPPFSLDDGLAETVAWYRAIHASRSRPNQNRNVKGVDAS